MKTISVSSDNVREVIKAWIDEADNCTIERIYNENFDEHIHYELFAESFNITEAEAERVGLLIR